MPPGSGLGGLEQAILDELLVVTARQRAEGGGHEVPLEVLKDAHVLAANGRPPPRIRDQRLPPSLVPLHGGQLHCDLQPLLVDLLRHLGHVGVADLVKSLGELLHHALIEVVLQEVGQVLLRLVLAHKAELQLLGARVSLHQHPPRQQLRVLLCISQQLLRVLMPQSPLVQSSQRLLVLLLSRLQLSLQLRPCLLQVVLADLKLGLDSPLLPPRVDLRLL
mmetsp:Transcript_2144/g.6534  ORF Transcript_2144/g.6534 Transcript_2144/m.6534 type:complete len:220 (+) Transcript_2144:1273-1932(+)